MLQKFSPSAKLALACALCAVLASLGCSKASGDTGAAASGMASASMPAASASAPSLAPAYAPAAMIPLAPTQADRVGTLAPNTGIPVGQKVPDARVRDLEGHDVTLSSLYANGPILLVFYRGGWCPYCNSEIHALTTAFPEYQKRGITPIAISVDRPEAEAKLKATYTIPFPVLSDTDAATIDAFHVARKMTDEELTMLKQHGRDLEGFAGAAHHKIAIPSLFLVDRTGTVRWAHSDQDFKTRPTNAQILAALDALKLEKP